MSVFNLLMVFTSHSRLARTSSDLRTLSAALLPPSPILKADSADYLPVSSVSSGEIPILLPEDTRHVRDSRSRAFGEQPGLRDVARELNLINNLGTDIGNTSDVTRGDEASPPRGGPSDDTCILPNEAYAEPANSTRTVSGESKGSISPARDDATAGDGEHASISGDRSTPLYVKHGKLERSLDSQASSPSTMEVSTATVIPKEDLDGDCLLMIATLPTPTFASPSPSSSTEVMSPLFSPVGRRHRRLERARAVRFPGRPRSPRWQVTEAEAHLLTGSAPCVIDTRGFDAAHPFVKHVAVPDELPWIKRMAIELWIDQEGFRAVKSCMQLMGYSPRARSLHPYESAENAGSSPTGGVAEFMPTKRETFTFHYATLDSPPTLRMVSVGGDESRDYISRQATLSVKANGVYTVLGTESALASALNSDTYGSRLCWKFDYLVGDRKVDGTGKALPGEKTLTPLTFSCSPYLFHPLQGKKTGLMHIMKKNLVPKLGSQKLEPPTSPNVLPRTSRHLSTRDAAPLIRSRSDASAKNGHYHSQSLARSTLDAGVGGETILGIHHIPRTRRRRASSAGENSFSCPRNEPRHGGIVEGLLTSR